MSFKIPAGRPARSLKVAFAVAAAAVLVAIVLAAGAPVDKSGAPQTVDVAPGMTWNQLAAHLEEKQLISNSLYFKVFVRLFGEPPLFTGEYSLSPAETAFSQFQKIRRGQTKQKAVTFPEGLNHYEMFLVLKSAGFVEADEFLRLAKDSRFAESLLREATGKSEPIPPSLEGFLFPDTYLVNKYKPASALLREMTAASLKIYDEIVSQAKQDSLAAPPPAPVLDKNERSADFTEGKTPSAAASIAGGAQNLPGSAPGSATVAQFSLYEAVTLASLIEKETGAPPERGLVSSVFHNRLKQGMKLQSDPTILYGLFLKEGFARPLSIRKKDILHPSPYNTYVISGLPPGPIANPGRESLRAVFYPEKTDYLYFVSRNDGTHVFSKSLAEHEKAVFKHQIAPFRKKNKP